MSSTPAPIVLLTGGSGLIGRALTETLIAQGYGVRNLSRKPSPSQHPRYQEYAWDPQSGTLDESALEGVEYVVHMAGAGINDKRWTKRYKKTILQSRVLSTRCIVEHLSRQQTIPRFISFSGTAIYGDRGAEEIDECSSTATGTDDFLCQVCHAWEQETQRIESHILRVPPVLTHSGGALPTMVQSSRRGVIGVIDDPQNFFSWVHIQDLIEMVLFLMRAEQPPPVTNACSPTPVTNRQLMHALKSHYRLRGLTLTIPSWLLSMVVGPVAQELAKSLRAHSAVLVERGFEYKYPELDQALAAETSL